VSLRKTLSQKTTTQQREGNAFRQSFGFGNEEIRMSVMKVSGVAEQK
jgi:hypothetical protein